MKRFYEWRWRISSRVKEPYEERRTSSFNKDEVKNLFSWFANKENLRWQLASCVLMKMKAYTFMCMWVFSLFWNGIFFIFYSWIIRGNKKRVTTASKKDKYKIWVALFNNDTNLFILFSFVPFLPLVSCLGSRNIHRLIKDSQSLEVCVSHIKGTCWFSLIMFVSLFFLGFWCVTLILHYQTSFLFLSIYVLSFFLMQFELTLL